MTFGTFLMTFGLIGASLLVGVIVRTFWIADEVQGVGLWLVVLLSSCAVLERSSLRTTPWSSRSD